MKFEKLTDEKIERIRELYLEQGLSSRQVGKELGIGQSTVMYQLRKMDISRKPLVLKEGDRRPTSDGYIAVYMPSHPNSVCTGFVLEHRLVMSKKLGRPLTENEVVHHINENRKDNRPENLQLYDSPGIHNFKEHRHPRFIGYSNEELLEHIRTVAKEIGKKPTIKDMENRLPHWTTYFNHFGSWKKAVELAGI